MIGLFGSTGMQVLSRDGNMEEESQVDKYETNIGQITMEDVVDTEKLFSWKLHQTQMIVGDRLFSFFFFEFLIFNVIITNIADKL